MLCEIGVPFSLEGKGKFLYSKIVYKSIKGDWYPPSQGGGGSDVMLDEELNSPLLCFFYMKENHFGNILGNEIYLTLAP